MKKLAAYSWLMFPVYVWQGLGVRRRIERLLPEHLPVEGNFRGREPQIRLLVAGDSTVAGVGMDHVENTLAWNIANALHARTGRAVYWRSAGGNSATTADVRDHIIPHVERRDWTHVVISAGTNDMKNFHAVRTFKQNFGSLIYALRSRFAGARIIWASIPDMRKFPALPRGLAAVLAARATLINETGRQLCDERGAHFADPLPIHGPEGFARDGFHPGSIGYRLWGEHLADHVLIASGETATVTPIHPSRKKA